MFQAYSPQNVIEYIVYCRIRLPHFVWFVYPLRYTVSQRLCLNYSDMELKLMTANQWVSDQALWIKDQLWTSVHVHCWFSMFMLRQFNRSRQDVKQKGHGYFLMKTKPGFIYIKGHLIMCRFAVLYSCYILHTTLERELKHVDIKFSWSNIRVHVYMYVLHASLVTFRPNRFLRLAGGRHCNIHH